MFDHSIRLGTLIFRVPHEELVVKFSFSYACSTISQRENRRSVNRLTKIRRGIMGQSRGVDPRATHEQNGHAGGFERFCVSKQTSPGSYPRDSDMMVSNNLSQRQETLEYWLECWSLMASLWDETVFYSSSSFRQAALSFSSNRVTTCLSWGDTGDVTRDDS